MSKSIEDHDMELQMAINNNQDYIKSQETVAELLEKLKDVDKKTWIDLDSEIRFSEALARDTAFNEGFKLGIRLILSSIV